MDSAQASNRLTPRGAWAVFGAALAARLAFLAVFLLKDLDKVFGRDVYYSVAMSWLGFGPRLDMDATHPPLYSAFLSGVLGLARTPNPLPALLLQVVLSALSCVLLWRLAERMGAPRAGRLAACWMAFDPGLVFYAPQLQTETLFVALELAFFLALYASLEETPNRCRRAFGAGLLGAAASLCRSVFAAYPAFLIPALLPLLGRRRLLPWSAALLLGWALPILGWTARNYARYGRVIPISAQMGWTLYEGFTLDRRELERRPTEMDEESRRLGILGPMERSAYFKKKTLDFVRAEPLRAAGIVVGKAFLYWRPWPYDPYTLPQRICLGAYYVVVFLLGAVGAWSARTRTKLLPVLALFAYLTASHAVFFTSLRYRMPLEPFLCLLAAAGAALILDSRRAVR